jgi:hypothetical protein
MDQREFACRVVGTHGEVSAVATGVQREVIRTQEGQD